MADELLIRILCLAVGFSLVASVLIAAFLLIHGGAL